MTKQVHRLAFAVLPLLASLAAARDAAACGGCFHPENQPVTQASVVVSHRMALSISPDESVLWDQVEYAGSPADFAWVLPVKPGARLELASDAWFETLDAATSVRITAPTIQCVTTTLEDQQHSYGYSGCGGPASTMGCGSDGAGLGEPSEVTQIDELAPPPEDPVTVVHKGSAGPYETVTLHSDVPGALSAWLAENGYAVDATVQPIIDQYASDGFDFIALRLLPEIGVQQMKPVRVVQPGAATTLPLRMVAAGTGESVSMTLFVIGEGRYRVDDFAEAQALDGGDLLWDFATQQSDYASQRAQRLLGASWMTTYAQQGSLFTPMPGSTGVPIQYATGLGNAQTIADALMDHALSIGETQLSCAGIFDPISWNGQKVVNLCPPGGGACSPLGSGELDARYFTCGPLDDLAVAMTGLHPLSVWVTRLEADLPRSALATDLALAPAAQEPVSNLLTATGVANAPCPIASASALAPRSGSSGGGGGRALMIAVGAAIVAGAIARRIGRPAGATVTR